MTAHTCTTYDPTCYRCDLGRDEARRITEEDAACAAAGHPYDSFQSCLCGEVEYPSETEEQW